LDFRYLLSVNVSVKSPIASRLVVLLITSLKVPYPLWAGIARHASSVSPIRRSVMSKRDKRIGVLVAKGL